MTNIKGHYINKLKPLILSCLKKKKKTLTLSLKTDHIIWVFLGDYLVDIYISII